MSPRRLWHVLCFDLVISAKRPICWIWAFLVLLSALILATPVLHIASGEDMAGGVQAHLTSQFANAYQMSLLVAMFFPLFVAVTAGMGVLRDGELRFEKLLHSTPLKTSEYVWGSFLAGITTSGVMLALLLGLSALFKHVLIGAGNSEAIGEFAVANYVAPALYFAVPLILFVAGLSFAVGEHSRKPLLVNMVPLALMLGCLFFLWTWSPSWLDPRWNRLLMLVDPTGFRWLSETWIKVDRGAEFYNTARVILDPAFILSRLAFGAAGLAAVMLSVRHLARTLRGTRVAPRTSRAGVAATDVKLALAARPGNQADPAPVGARLAGLGMTSRPPGFLAGLLEVTRVEVRTLARHPAMWVLIPLVVLNCTVDAIYAVGPFDNPLLLTPGVAAVGSLAELTFTLCLLLMFYMCESMRREQTTRFYAISYATPVRTSALILGKALASSAVGAVTLLAVFATCGVLLLRQGTVPFDGQPFLIVYGLLLGPTVFFWCALVGLLFALTGSRLTTHALAIAAIILTPILIATDRMSWVWNWSLAGALRWSDIAVFELDRKPLALNRALVLAVAVLFLTLAVRIFPRRQFDPVRIHERLRAAALARGCLLLLPLLLAPLVLGVVLQKGINRGTEGRKIEKWARKYWQRNHATWLEVAPPSVVRSEIKLELEPERGWFRTRGSYQLENLEKQSMARIPITGGPHWENLSWTLNGAAYVPDEREGLYLFIPPQPLAPGQVCSVGFEFEGVFPPGLSRNGEEITQFILPSGVLLTASSPTFVPVPGYLEGLGISEDNEYDAREYPADFHMGVTRALFGADSGQTTRIEITAPERFTMNSVGVMTESVVAGGKRTVVWESDYPVSSFNVVGGLWEVRRGDGTAIFYHPQHGYNIDEMIEALDGARRLYSEWFFPFPWAELKLSEFPAQASYAQGHSTNITFSEDMGFLVKSDRRMNVAFMVTAHEAAHQWWGGLVLPGKGPGGNILSEGMAHFSTILLFDALRGAGPRIEFCRRIEDKYCVQRSVDSERALVLIDGTRDGDHTVTYDKGAWVFWMVLDLIGRDHALDGIRSFVAHYAGNRDHPVLQDFVEHLRPFAPEPQAYDEFIDQWFFDVVLPEYVLQRQSRKQLAGGGWEVQFVIRNGGTGRMSVEVAAERGVRFPAAGAQQQAEPFEDQRTRVVLGRGESMEVSLGCSFEPQRIVIDPDAKVLQRGRKFAIHRF